MSGIIGCKYLEDIKSILESGLLEMEEKEKFLNDIKEKSKDKDVLEGIKFEDNMEYRFKLVEEDAYERGLEQGLEQGLEKGLEQGLVKNTVDIIKSMLSKKISYQDISDISGKSLEEIKEIEKMISNE